jgi:hypothetical protein
LNDEERVRVEFAAAGGTPTCESLALGESRGFVAAPTEIPALRGSLKVSRILYHRTQPVVSITRALPVGTSEDDRAVFEATRSLRLHAEHFFVQSEGVPTALYLATGWDRLKSEVRFSGGIVVQPVAASALGADGAGAAALDAVRRLDATFAHMDVDAYALPDDAAPELIAAGSAADAVAEALAARAADGLLCHDLLGWATGDWAGARDVLDRARHTVPDVAPSSEILDSTVPPQSLLEDKYAPLASSAAAAEEGTAMPSVSPTSPAAAAASSPGAFDSLRRIELDVATTTRTPLDFFCRCSAESVKRSVALLGREGALNVLGPDGTVGVDCVFCGKRTSLSKAEVESICDTTPPTAPIA